MEMIKLNDICDVRDGTHDSPQYVTEGYPLVTSKNIIDGQIDITNVSYISEEDYEAINKRSNVDHGDILMPMIGTIGKPVIVNKEFEFAIKNVALIKFNEESKVLPTYIRYVLDSNLFNRYVEKENRGGTQKFISLGNIRNFPIPVVSLEKQKEITSILNKLSQIIKSRKLQMELLDNLVKSRFVEMFGDPVSNPMGWEVKELNELCDVRDGTHDSPSYVSEGYPLVTSKNIVDGKLDLGNVNYITQEDYDNINRRSKVDMGDIIMPMIGTIGNPLIILEEPRFAIKNVALIKFNKTSICNMYIHSILCSELMEHIKAEKSRGGTQKFLSLGDIRKLKIPVPDEQLQNQYANLVQQVHKLKFEVKKSLDETQLLFDSLMQIYFE